MEGLRPLQTSRRFLDELLHINEKKMFLQKERLLQVCNSLNESDIEQVAECFQRAVGLVSQDLFSQHLS